MTPPRGADSEGALTALLFVLFAVAFGTNVPTPLLLWYRAELGLSATELTVIFGVYAAGLLPALLLAGAASDRYGRRPVAAPFVVLSGLASLVFLPAATRPELLYLGRFLQGAVSGVVFSVGSAWVADLLERPAVAARRTTIAVTAGFGLGPLVAGVLGQWAPGPGVTSYLIHVAAIAVAVERLRRVPDVSVRKGRGPWLDLGVPRGAGVAFLTFVLPVGLCVFTFPSLSVTILPLELESTLVGIELAVTGAVAAVTMSAGVLVQPLSRRLGETRLAPAGPIAGGAGLGIAVLASALAAWPLLLVSAALLGSGYGLTLTAGLTGTEQLAEPSSRGALTASFYGVAYAGFATPTLVSLGASGGDFRLPLLVTTATAAMLAAVVAGPGRRHLTRHATQNPRPGRSTP